VADFLVDNTTIPELVQFAIQLKGAISAMDILALMESPQKLALLVHSLRGTIENREVQS